jgi:ribosomal protein S18 acetylase RimI-like enzyme
MSDESPARPLAIQRLTSVDNTLAAQLNPLFDEGTEWDAEQGRRFLQNPDNLFLVARWDGFPCGFLTAHRLQRFDRRRAEVLLYEIGVDDRFRRRGAGTALIAEVRRWAKEVGADEVWVLTDAGNAAAMALYTSTGGQADPPGTTMFTYRID